MKLAITIWLAFSTSGAFVDPDLQPECRARCDEEYAVERNACANERYGADECLAAAEDRHQECIDRCND